MSELLTPPTTGLAQAGQAIKSSKHRSIWMDSLYRLSRNPGSIIGAILLTVMILTAIGAPYLTRFDPIEMVPDDRLKEPSSQFWLGTDHFGRDMYTRILYGGQISLRVGIISVCIALAIGVPLGLISGYNGGWMDTLIMRMVDIMLAFPGILLALGVIAVLGPSLFNVMIAVGISAVPNFSRVTRGSVLKTKEEVFIEAAVVVGCPTPRILLRHILPNILGPIVVMATLGVAGAIISGAALSFLGLGAARPTPEWGLLLSDGRQYLRYAWWISTFPGVAIMISVLSINLLGDGLRDALDPRMKRE